MRKNSGNKGKDKKPYGFDLSTYIYGKIPPSAPDLERAIIGILLMEPKSIMDVKEILKPDDFYLDAHQKILKAMYDMDSRNIMLDLLLVTDELRANGTIDEIGGPYYLTACTGTVVSSANIREWCLIVKQYSVARHVIALSSEVMQKVMDGEDILDSLSVVEGEFRTIGYELDQIGERNTGHILMDTAKAFEMRIANYKDNTYVPRLTGIPAWDRINGELFQGGIYTVAARPGMGKTAFMIQSICSSAHKDPIGVINGEMTDEQICKRIVCNSMNLDNYIFKKRPDWITDEEKNSFQNGLIYFYNLQMHIESKTLDVDRICNKLRFWKRKYNIKKAYIDFLQILRVAPELERYMTGVQKLDYILDALASTAKELKIPIILFSQLNRENIRRGGSKEPNLADLKGSGKIEEISFQVSFLHRPEYYEEGTDEASMTDEWGNSIRGLCYQIVAKHRDGELGRMKHKFIGKYFQFKEWEDELGGFKAMATQEELPF